MVFIIAFITLIIIILVVSLRIELIGSYRIKMVDKIYDHPKNSTERGLLHKMYHANSYDKMLFDFRKWTFKQFYGDI